MPNMRVSLVSILAVVLSSCAVLGDRRVAAGCQAADGLTTFYALKHGAIETNGLLSNMAPAQLLALKLAFAYAIYKIFPPIEKASTGDKVAAGAVSLVGCLPAANNIKVIRSLK